ncbi:erythrocyte membrane protein 1 [Plasmodium falciparum IGH-CR14]|uniref:Erythrocyte membrane protein 1 n=1 Tax=Plasmodium falciparum IGH-CR14 TaxID=580059 RepID=A0A0L1I536_PLAFA|nr:erythrocyte membrane protein 1 [Plasmodium falciparum IGH-CR14]
MAPKPTAPDYNSATNVKELLDMIGQDVYDQVEKKAVDYRNYLQGRLSQATFTTRQGVQTSHVSDACHLIYEYDTNVTGGFDTNNPCANRLDVRFSDKYGGQCTNEKIHGNDPTNGGACAPFRRLFLCDHHLSHMKDDKINTKDNLLLEVCLAAKYEGQSLVKKYNEYKERHNVFPSDICTILARSFADIGDIIRGKDLFIGYNEKDKEEKKQLQDNLKKIFKEIYDKLVEKKKDAETHYGGDAPDFYQLREDWWYANRKEVWTAITCGAGESDKYFRQTACAGTFSTNTQCRCAANIDPPTYFDYVPQYLRWFEEWAEDFCRLRKRKLEDAITNCGGKDGSGKERYCDRNGYDCTRTIRGKKILVSDPECANCYVGCTDFVPWIKNQKQEFLKQKKKYTQEINKTHDTTMKIGATTINNLYVDDFYKKLQKHCPTAESFLKKLNDEKICKDELTVVNETASRVDFTKDDGEIFSHTEYCETCPWCATKKKENGKWENKDHGNCTYNGSTHFDNSNTTNIKILSTNIAEHNILEKYKNFCDNTQNDNEIKKWQCHYESTGNDNCIEGEWNNFTKDQTIKPYDIFFSHWIKRMLEDSIKWREQFNNCINNENATKCIKWCKTPCKCYKKWVERMKEEWGDIKQHFHKEKDLVEDHHFTILEMYVEDQFLPSIEDAYGNDEAIENIEELLEERRTHADSDLKDEEKKNIIDYLLEHEGKDAEKCTSTHTGEVTCTAEVNLHNNPCAKHINKRSVSVKDIARKMKSNARKLLRNRGGKDELKGNISLAEFKNGVKGSDLNGKICNIDNKYSNDIRGTAGGPCKGKDGSNERFKIGTYWKDDQLVSTIHKDVFLPPRREHMCTSNLEHLNTGNKGLSNSSIASNSLLGDVLLAAKEEAEDIKNNYNEGNNGQNKGKTGLNNEKTVCRAVRYSFADLGDIIRGRDMWDKDVGMQKLEPNLKNIFENIKEKNPNIKSKYTDDDNGKYTKLREDWWSANRIKIWSAMKCALKSDNIQCRMTPDDYIPQRLRWMTEWAEWYCKAQNKYYGELLEKCGSCMGKGNGQGCTSGDSVKKCENCTKACKDYNSKIEPWRDQWKKIKDKYEQLYIKAQNGDTSTSGTGDPKDENDVVDFLKQLLPQNSAAARNRVKRAADSPTEITALTPNTPYSTAAGYIHQEAPIVCDTQREFCEYKNGDNSNSGKTNEKYAFRSKPYDHDEACKCENNTRPPAPEPKKQKDACKIVGELLKGNNGTTKVGECNVKTEGEYPEWECEKKIQNIHKGACMPPRRQKLCIHDLKALKSDASEEELREAFINCAAIETHFSWHYYKSKKRGADTQKQLKEEKIPDEFKKIMYYTFADYKDICLGTDISSDTDIKGISEKVIKILEKQNVSQRKDEEQHIKKKNPGDWWKEHAPDIWKGILCGLVHDYDEEFKTTIRDNTKYKYEKLMPSLEEFAQTPQFLRWFIEWGDEFCRERDTLEKNVEESCKDAQCNIDGTRTNKTECENACKNYTTYIKDKKSEYNEQKSKFDAEKIKGNGLYVNYKDKEAYDYLKEKCIDNGCNCLSDRFSDEEIWEKPVDTLPENITEKCNCPKPSEPMSCVEMSAKEIRKAAQKNIERKLKGKGNMYNGKCKNLDKKEYMTENGGKCKFNEGMRSTYKSIIQECDTSEKKRFDIKEYWDCSAKTSGNKNTLCIPPRRKYMCLKKLENIKAHDIKSSDELLKEIQEVAKSEGDDIIEKLLPYNACNENVICSAMKYSFADLGDILRGRNVLIGYKGHNEIERKLNIIFTNIKSQMENKYEPIKNNYPHLKSFRSAWWDANRTKVWNAMTCNAPTDAALVKKETTNTTDSLIKKYEVSKKCNYNSDPPDDDYIPQPFRWLQEWSEHFCRVQKDKLDKLKTACGECDQNKTDLACMINSNSNDNKCIKCKNACNDYRNMIDGWNRQWKKQQETYKELYTFKNGVDIHKINVKEFLDKMIEKCDTNMENSNDFLSRASHCTNLTFDKTKNKNNIPYAFQHPPDKYNVLCGTMYRKSCQKLKRLESNNVCEKKYNLIRESSTWQKLPNEFIYVPPRTQQLCLEPLQALISSTKKTTKVTEYDFSKTLQICAYNEAKFLHNYYSKDGKDLVFSGDASEATEDEIKKHILECMKRSFADYGDLIKGTTKYDYNGTKLNILDLIKKVGYNDKSPETLEYVWNIHKSDLWHAMICGYNACNPNKLLHEEEVMCKLPDNDSQDEFLRWFTEWTEDFCMYKKTKMKYFKNNCTFNSCDLANSKEIHKCLETCQKYKNWIEEKKIEYTNQKKKYNKKYKKSIEDKNDANEFLKNTCEGKCKCITEKANSNNMDNVFEEYPEGFKTKCECYPEQCRGLSVTDSYIPDGSPFGGGQSLNECRLLQGTHNKCPTEEICNIYKEKTKRCHVKTYDDYFSNWDSRGMLNTSSENEGVLVPPRRRHICLRISTEHFRQLKKKPEVFERLIYSSATNEAQGLIKKYGNDNNKLLQAIKYSFADIGNVVKGDDMMQSPTSEYIGKVLGDEKGSNDRRIRWWNTHKKNVWDAMLCTYKKYNKQFDNNYCQLPKEDETPQFLRWFQEWTEHFCSRRNKLYSTLEDKCKSVNCNTKNGKIDSYECKRACQAYENYVFSKKLEYHIQNKQYETNFKQSQDNKDITVYFKDKSNGKCNCLSEYFSDSKNWENPYESITNPKLKQKCDCKKVQPPPPKPSSPEVLPSTPSDEPFDSTILQTTIPFGIAFALGSIAFLFLKKKTKSSVGNLFQILQIPKSDYDIPTKLSPNRYIPYTSGKYRGKRYIYLEGDSGTDSGYTDHYSDITSSSESEYEELDINDIYVPGSPKYKTLIEVVLEPSGKLSGNTIPASGKNTPSDTQNDIQNDGIPSSKITDNEWNTLKHDFISNMLQSEQNKEPNMLGYNVDNNTNPKTLHVSMDEKPFIMSIHDRDLYTGEEYNYNVNMVNSMDDPKYVSNNVYSGIDLINDSLSGDYDIYNEMLKRKENELFGTEHHPKRTTTNHFATPTRDDPLHNQLELFHKWLDRHRDMCEKWNNKEELLDKLKEEWENETHSGNTHPSDSNKTLNTDVSIQIHMDNPKPINQFTNMDTILENLDKYNEPYYDVQDDIYYDVNDETPSVEDIPMDHNKVDVPSKVQIEMDVNTKLVKEKYPIADVWDI